MDYTAITKPRVRVSNAAYEPLTVRRWFDVDTFDEVPADAVEKDAATIDALAKSYAQRVARAVSETAGFIAGVAALIAGYSCSFSPSYYKLGQVPGDEVPRGPYLCTDAFVAGCHVWAFRARSDAGLFENRVTAPTLRAWALVQSHDGKKARLVLKETFHGTPKNQIIKFTVNMPGDRLEIGFDIADRYRSKLDLLALDALGRWVDDEPLLSRELIEKWKENKCSIRLMFGCSPIDHFQFVPEFCYHAVDPPEKWLPSANVSRPEGLKSASDPEGFLWTTTADVAEGKSSNAESKGADTTRKLTNQERKDGAKAHKKLMKGAAMLANTRMKELFGDDDEDE